MIFGDINNVDDMKSVYKGPLLKVIDYLKKNDFTNMKPGEYEIEGRDIYAQVAYKSTKDKSEAKPEIHRKYIDVQFSLEGKEKIGFARDTNKNEVSEDLLDKEDVLFYKDLENEVELTMVPGTFAVFFPNDVHRPWCADGEPCKIKKVNVKVNTAIL